MAPSLPNNPDLERFRRDARRLQRETRAGNPEALAIVRRHHPDGAPPDPARFSLTAAQHVIARAYCFASWPKLKEYLVLAEPLRRDPTTVPADLSPVDRFCELACLQYSGADDPERWARAGEILAADPGLLSRSIFAAAAAGDPDAVRQHLAADSAAARREGGPFRWSPLLYLTYSRIPQADPMTSATLLLDNGADANTGYLWLGLPTPFTALTGCFGEGEGGPGRQPRHPEGDRLARLLLERGAVANDGQTLYNRMFGRDDSHLILLLEFGLGTGDIGIWRRRLGDAAETVEEMMKRQLDWAAAHGFDQRLELLAGHGIRLDRQVETTVDIHRAGTPTAVREMVAAGADVDARLDGHTALHHFAWIGDAEMVRALLDAGADANLLDNQHRNTPLGWAEYGRQPTTAALLRPITTTRGR